MTLLPIGTIVNVEGGEFMVSGFGMISDGECFKYALLPYPMGQTFDNQMLLTNEDYDVIFEGYKDEEHGSLEILVEKTIDMFNNKL